MASPFTPPAPRVPTTRYGRLTVATPPPTRGRGRPAAASREDVLRAATRQSGSRSARPDRIEWGLGDIARFHTPRGLIGAHREISGVRTTSEEMVQRAITAEIGDLAVHVVGYDDLIRIKRAAGRPQDLADIAALEDSRRGHSAS